jgi:hypothetical protein
MKPFALPSERLEFAKMADTMGETPVAVRIFATMSASSAKSKFAWTVAVAYIMSRARAPRFGR